MNNNLKKLEYDKILEKIASRSSSTPIIRKSEVKKVDMSHVVKEKNQRTSMGRIESFADKLKCRTWIFISSLSCNLLYGSISL